MFDRNHLAGVYAVVAAAASLIVAPLLAMAYFATEEGAEYLGTSTVSAWADPGSDAAETFLTFASADRVYSTYLQLFALLFPAVLVCALIVRSRRPQQSVRLERWGWRLALLGYGVLATGLVAAGLLLALTKPSSPLVSAAAFGLVFPGIFLSTTGSSMLGIALLRYGYRPRATAWLLALGFPLWIVGSFVAGHNGIGLVPLLVAWAATGWQLARAEAPLRPGPLPHAEPAD